MSTPDVRAPVRIQRKRTKGWRMPEGAIYVGRPTLWGNEWTVRDAITWSIPMERRRAWLVGRYRQELERGFSLLSAYSYMVSEAAWDALSARVRALDVRSMAEAAPHFLAGHDLVCWCPLDQPCHADVLLEIANGARASHPKED